MGIAISLSTMVIVLAIAFSYGIRRHYDAYLKKIEVERDLEMIRQEHKSEEFSELKRRVDELNSKVTKLMVSR